MSSYPKNIETLILQEKLKEAENHLKQLSANDSKIEKEILDA